MGRRSRRVPWAPALLLGLSMIAVPWATTGVATPGPGLTEGGSPTSVDLISVFEDDFDGDALGPDWAAHPHTGTITVADGHVTLIGGRYFPLIETTTDPIPADLPFRVRFTFQFLDVTRNGDGLGVLPQGFFDWQGSCRPCRMPFAIWADAGLGGIGLYLHGESVMVPGDTEPHTIEYGWNGVVSTVWYDGVPKLHRVGLADAGQTGQNLWVGNLHECCPGADYSDIRVDRVTVDVSAGL